MNTTSNSLETSVPTPTHAQPRPVDMWSDDFVDKYIIDSVKPLQPPLAIDSSVIALGSGFSAMLRGRAFAKSANVLSVKKFGAALPMEEWTQLSPIAVFQILDWALRSKGSNPIENDVNADRIRRRVKRALQQSHLLAVTFGIGGTRAGTSPNQIGALTAAEVCNDTKKIYQLVRRFFPNTRLLIAIDPTPVARSAEADVNLTASTGLKSTLRAGLEEFLSSEASAMNKDLFYFPAFELAAEHGDRQASERSVLDVFKAYYTLTGPTTTEAGRAFALSRLRQLAAARKKAPPGLATGRVT